MAYPEEPFINGSPYPNGHNGSPPRPFLTNLLGDKWLILVVTALVVLMSLVYVVLLYRPLYKTEATVLLKSTSIGSLVSSIDTDRANQPTTAAASPMLTHVNILESRQLSASVFKAVRRLYPNSVSANTNPQNFLRHYLTVNSVISSDSLELTLNWSDPKQAKAILDEVLRQYMAANRDINRRIVDKKRDYLDREMQTIETKLADVRNKIEQYQRDNNTISLDAESNELVRQRGNLSDKLADLAAQISNTRSAMGRMQGELGMNSHEAIQAVALGSENTTLVQLQDDLAKVRQDIAFEGVRLAATNPKMVALNQKAASINAMLKQHMRQSLGSKATLPSDDIIPLRGTPTNLAQAPSKAVTAPARPASHIYDSVRTQMVSQLVDLQVHLKGLQAEYDTLSGSLANLTSQAHAMPGKALALKSLLQEEANLATAYDEVRKKQIEANLQDANLTTNAVVLDAPYVPTAPAPPYRWHLVLLAIVLGLVTGSAISILKTQVQQIRHQAEHQLKTA
jgi:uncharacterized protein involved in exopolysaccharide biosynthesis